MNYLYQNTDNVLLLPWAVEPPDMTTFDVVVADGECTVWEGTVDGRVCDTSIILNLLHECGPTPAFNADIGTYRIHVSVAGTVYASTWATVTDQQSP